MFWVFVEVTLTIEASDSMVGLGKSREELIEESRVDACLGGEICRTGGE